MTDNKDKKDDLSGVGSEALPKHLIISRNLGLDIGEVKKPEDKDNSKK